MREAEWIVVFRDSEMCTATFDEEEQARAFFDRVRWNCALYRLMAAGWAKRSGVTDAQCR